MKRAAILLLGIIVVGLIPALTTHIYERMHYLWDQSSVALVDIPIGIFMVATCAAMAFGLPCAFVLARFNADRWWVSPVVGFLAAVAASLFLGLPEAFTEFWNLMCAAGAVGGLVFWPFWRWSMWRDVSGASR